MSPDPVVPGARQANDTAIVPAPAALPPPGNHTISFRDRKDAEKVAQIYYAECKTKDLKNGKEYSVAELAKKLEKDLDMANGRYNSARKPGEVQMNPFNREAFTKKWLADHVGDAQLNFDGESKSATDFVKSVRGMVNNKRAVETPTMLEAVSLHFKGNRNVSQESLSQFYDKNIVKVAEGDFRLKGDIKVDDEGRGSLHLGILHLKGRSRAGLPGGSITLGTDDRKWGAEGERVLKVEEVKSKKK